MDEPPTVVNLTPEEIEQGNREVIAACFPGLEAGYRVMEEYREPRGEPEESGFVISVTGGGPVTSLNCHREKPRRNCRRRRH